MAGSSRHALVKGDVGEEGEGGIIVFWCGSRKVFWP